MANYYIGRDFVTKRLLVVGIPPDNGIGRSVHDAHRPVLRTLTRVNGYSKYQPRNQAMKKVHFCGHVKVH